MQEQPTVGLCGCGCGQRTTVAVWSNTAAGRVKGQPARFVNGHYGQWSKLRYVERFWSKVEKTDGCWRWQGTIDPSTGYGRIRILGRDVYAHRLAYEQVIGPIPEGLVIDHLCRVRSCVNPEHLEPVTRGENVRRGTRLITHCPQGHPYDEKNTLLYKGKRQCRACKRERDRVRREKTVVS